MHFNRLLSNTVSYTQTFLLEISYTFCYSSNQQYIVLLFFSHLVLCNKLKNKTNAVQKQYHRQLGVNLCIYKIF